MTVTEIFEHIKLVISAVRCDGSYPANEALGQEFAEIAALTAELDEYKKRDTEIAKALYPHKEEPFTYSPIFFADEITKKLAELERVRGERDALNAMAPCDSCRTMYQEVCAKLAAAKALKRDIYDCLGPRDNPTGDLDDDLRNVIQGHIVCDKERDALREQVAQLEAECNELKREREFYREDGDVSKILQERDALREQVARLSSAAKRGRIV